MHSTQHLDFFLECTFLLIFISKQRTSICTKREKSRIKSFSPKSRFSLTGEMATNLRKRRASCGLFALRPAVCRLSQAHPSPPPHCSLKWGKVKNNWWKWCAQAEWWVGDITGNKTDFQRYFIRHLGFLRNTRGGVIPAEWGHKTQVLI